MRRQLVFFMLLACLLASCATVSSRPMLGEEEKEMLLRERAMGCWEALKAGDREKVYDMYDPFFRIRVTKKWFSSMGAPISYKHFEIVDIDIRGNVAAVFMKVAYRIEHIDSKRTTPYIQEDTQIIPEIWLFMDGNWYRQHTDKQTGGTFAHY